MLGAYGIIGNGTSVGIVSSLGSLDWLCCPDSDMGSHFAALLDDRSGGRFSIRPGGKFSSSQKYLGKGQRSAVLETHFVTPQGKGRLIDWMPWGPSPAVLRRVETLEGQISWDLFCLPRFHYGQLTGLSEKVSEGICFRAQVIGEFAQISGNQEVRLDTMLGAGIARFELSAGESRQFVWAWGRNAQRSQALLDLKHEDSLREWDDWLHPCDDAFHARACPSHPLWHEVFIRSEVVLRLLSHSGTGALIQTPCTSLPCVRGGSQNWDHRYCWLRNCPDALSAWIATGHTLEAKRLWGWVSDRILASPPQ
ncbi:hypothetical protein EBZ37_13290, partial [bacterium]|nr:hypothetical protein [bacterium]